MRQNEKMNTTAWEKEKAYCAERAEKLGAEMDEATAAGDRERFTAAYQTAIRYMTVQQRSQHFKRWLESTNRERSYTK